VSWHISGFADIKVISTSAVGALSATLRGSLAVDRWLIRIAGLFTGALFLKAHVDRAQQL